MRGLSDEEKRACLDALLACDVAGPAVCARAVEETRILTRGPTLAEVRGARSLIAHVALTNRADGITLGRRVFLRADRVDASGRAPPDLIAHEVAHVAQVVRDGLPRFLARYVADYAGGRARGLSDHAAYLAIPYEIEARRVAAALVR